MVFMVSAHALIAQVLPEIAFVRRVDSVISSKSVAALELKQVSYCSDHTTAWYLENRLICVNTLKRTDQSDVVETNYYVRNDTLVYATQRYCRTVPGISPRGGDDNVNDDKRPESRTNCLSLSMFLLSRRMLYEIDGENVFSDQLRLEQEEAALSVCFYALLNDLRKQH